MGLAEGRQDGQGTNPGPTVVSRSLNPQPGDGYLLCASPVLAPFHGSIRQWKSLESQEGSIWLGKALEAVSPRDAGKALLCPARIQSINTHCPPLSGLCLGPHFTDREI